MKCKLLECVNSSGLAEGGSSKVVQMKVLTKTRRRRMTMSMNDNTQAVALETTIENNKRFAHLTGSVSSSCFRQLLLVVASVIISLLLLLTPTLVRSNPLQAQLLQQVAKPLLVTAGLHSRQFTRDQRQQRPSSSNITTLATTDKRIKMDAPILMHPTTTKRPKATGSSLGSRQLKRLKISSSSLTEHEASSNSDSISVSGSSVNSTRYSSRRQSSDQIIDINNNGPLASLNNTNNDINNNTINGSSSEAQVQPNWNRNINSVNGTIDLSLYGNNDVDRLYGDALLVYLKNFNE